MSSLVEDKQVPRVSGFAGCLVYAAGGPAWLVGLVSGIASGLVLFAAAARSLVSGTH